MNEFQIDPKRGFLPDTDPLDHLPAYFAPWEELGRNLPKLLTASKLRAFIKNLPLLDADNLNSDAEKTARDGFAVVHQPRLCMG